MANISKINCTDSDGNDMTVNLQDTVSGYTTNIGTVTSVATGAGLTGGTITTSGTIKCKLKSETKSSLTAASMGSTSGRQYPVGLDSAGLLSVNVPWSNTTYTEGFGININSSHVISVDTIGALSNSSPSANVSVPNLTTTLLHSRVKNDATTGFDPGIYIVIATTTWSKNQYGSRRIYLATESGEGSNRYGCVQTSAITNNSSDAVSQQLYFISDLSGSAVTGLYLYGYQNSGATLTASYIGIQMVRVG